MPVAGNPNDAWEVRVIGEQEAQETNNVLHFVETTSTADVELNLILALAACYIEHILPIATSQWKLKELRWKRVHPTLGPEFVTVPEGALTGAGNAAALPSYCSAVISKRTEEGGRSKRGRIFIAGIPEVATTNSQFDTTHAYWTALVAFVACLGTKFIHIGEPLGSDQFALAVYSRKLGGDTYPLGAAGFEPVAQLVMNPVVATTRSRKLGRGR